MPSVRLAAVIHGVNTRTQNSYDKRVEAMEKNLLGMTRDRWFLGPFFWGDLGVQGDDFDALMLQLPQRSKSVAGWALGVLWNLIAGYGGVSAVATVKLGNFIRHLALGNEDRASEILEEIDVQVKKTEATADRLTWEAFEFVKAPLAPPVINFVGDVIRYHNPIIQQQIANRLLAELKDINEDSNIVKLVGRELGSKANPLTVLAHSLGGVFAFEMAIARDTSLWIDHLITMGSQPAFFYRVDPSRYSHLKRTRDGKLLLPATIRNWTNIIEPFDFLSFPVGESFLLSSGKAPRDIILKATSSGLPHGSYWNEPSVVAEALDWGSSA